MDGITASAPGSFLKTQECLPRRVETVSDMARILRHGSVYHGVFLRRHRFRFGRPFFSTHDERERIF